MTTGKNSEDKDLEKNSKIMTKLTVIKKLVEKGIKSRSKKNK